MAEIQVHSDDTKSRERGSEKILYIDPPSLLRWQPKGARTEILFLDIEPDFIDETTIRIDLNIIFRPIPLRRGSTQTRDYYVGSTGARVLFEAVGGRIKNHTRSTPLKIDYQNTYTHSRQSAVKLTPNLNSVAGIDFQLGEINFDRNVERSFTTKFSGSERILADIDLGYGVEWEVKLPEGQVIRDYLIGNLFLYIESCWDCDSKEGRIEVRPSDVLFFDSERRIIGSALKALAMRYVLWRAGIKLSRENIIISFKENC